MKKWWQKPLRGVVLDFTNCDPACIDIKSLVDQSFAGNVNTLIVSAIGHNPGGVAYYQSRLAPCAPGMNSRDWLAEAIEEAHGNGQKVVAAIACIWGGQELYQAHPDWAQHHATGDINMGDVEQTSIAFCPSSPYREHLFVILNEICDNYAVDGFYFTDAAFEGWCGCEHCLRKFREEYGADLPSHPEWRDPIWQAFVGWRYRQISDWQEALQKAVKSENRCVLFQGKSPLAQQSVRLVDGYREIIHADSQQSLGAGQYASLLHAVDLNMTAQLEDVIHLDLSRRSVEEPLWWLGISCRYAQCLARGKQITGQVPASHIPFDQVTLPETELRLTVAELLANNVSPLLNRNHLERVDLPAWDMIGALLGEVRKTEAYLEERESIKYIALLFSDATLNKIKSPASKPSPLDSFKGWANALLQEKILFDVITESDLEKGLRGYRVLVLPNTSCMSSQAKKTIREYAAEGYGVVGSYECGLFDELGKPSDDDNLAELFGIGYGENEPEFKGFDEAMTILPGSTLPAGIAEGHHLPTGGIRLTVNPAGARPVASVFDDACVQGDPNGEETGSPCLLAFDQGVHGRSVFFAAPLDACYHAFGVEDHRRLLAGAVRWAAQSEAPVRVMNAPLTLEVTAFYQPAKKRLIIHLVDSIQEELMHPITEAPELRDVHLTIETTGDVRGLEVLGDAHLPNASRWGNQLSVDLPPFRCHLELVVAYR